MLIRYAKNNMRLPKSIKDWLPIALLGLTGTILASLAVKSVANTKGPYLAEVIASLKTEPGGSIILILLILFLVALAWIVYLHYSQASDPESIRKKFKKNKVIGWMELDEIPFCPKCLANDPPLIVRLVEEFSDEATRDIWLCPKKCQCAFYGHKYRAIQQSKEKTKMA